MNAPQPARQEPTPRVGDWLPKPGSRLGVLAWVKARFPEIGPSLEAGRLVPLEMSFGTLDGVLAWGDRLPSRWSRLYADRRSLPCWTLEDGFLRSVGLGKDGAPPVSLLVDDVGPHFRAERPSRLEQLVAAGPDEETLRRARDVRHWIVRERLTKYNHLADRPPVLPRSGRRRILLVDQVRGDRSAGPPSPAAGVFRRMWSDAQRRTDTQIVVRSHPDVVAGRAAGQLRSIVGGEAIWIDDEISPHAVLDCVDEVWTVSSQLGLDALLRGVPVVTYGLPAYAGWGLTEDRADGAIARATFARRSRRPSLDALVAAFFLDYPIYYDPVRRRRTQVEGAIERLVSLRHRMSERKGRHLAVGFSRHKRRALRRFVAGPGASVDFLDPRTPAESVAAADHVLVWGAGAAPSMPGSTRPIRVEDGFIRSIGLGSALIAPSSLCFDRSALHSDATRASDLETLLNTFVFDGALLERAARLRHRIVEAAITKYNLEGGREPDYASLAGGRRVVVVGGQVPGDSSLALGLPLHESNLRLLEAVRGERPDAYLVYKEHPDLVGGLRPGATPRHLLERHADLVVGDVPVCGLLEAAAEVHVATSQLGFEAVLRGRRTICHGVPFYAGWGLTEQRRAPLRPRRRLTLDELVAGALILYPRYVSTACGLPCEVEDVVEELALSRPTPRIRVANEDRLR